jgi:hypothetical protein
MNQNPLIIKLSLIIWFLVFADNLYCQKEDIKFTHFYIDYPFEPSDYGTGGFTVNDFDNDGDFDITIQRQGTGKVYWYQNIGAERWVKYEIASDVYNQLGAASIDINNDGRFDLIMGTFWLENPGHLSENPNQQWIKHKYNGAMANSENHDIVAADINHDGSQDIVSYSQKFNNGAGVLRWYDITNPYDWKYFDIDTVINKREMPFWNNGVHAGFAPNGIGDLNNDDWCDIVMPQGWYENPKSQMNHQWILHRWNDYGINLGIAKTPYGTSMRTWICDFDQDGNNDIVFTDCDVENSKAYLIYNIKGGTNFKLEPLSFPEGPSGSLHSLGVADIEGDGDPDIFSGEQEDPDKGMKPEGLRERGFLWVNKGSAKNPVFEYQIINTDNPGWHDTILKDMDGDGDIDLITKVWNADEGNDGNPDRKWHLSYWKNITLNKKNSK